MSKTLLELRIEILIKKEKLGTWEAVGEFYKKNKGLLYRIAIYGEEPKGARHRQDFGLPALLAAPACAKCGKVHVTKNCRRTNHSGKYKDLFSIPTELLKWMLENREEIA